jgi:hypothetical protein
MSPPRSPLLQNALDSIQVGIEDYRQGTPPRLASAVRNFYAGVLLLAKEVLRRVSPPESNEGLIYERIGFRIAANGTVTFQGHGTKTVDVGTILERFAQLNLRLERQPLDTLQRIRNQLEHHAPQHSAAQMQEAIAATFRLVNEIIEWHLGEMPPALLDSETWDTMLKEERLFQHEIERCAESIEWLTGLPDKTKELLHHAVCPSCDSSLMENIGSFYHPSMALLCRVCGEEFEADAVIVHTMNNPDVYRRTIVDLSNITDCVTCGDAAFDLSDGVCLICGSEDDGNRR